MDIHSWMDDPLDIVYLDKSKPLDELPHKQAWVIDNFLTPAEFAAWTEWRIVHSDYKLSNRVMREGEMQHLYFGQSCYFAYDQFFERPDEGFHESVEQGTKGQLAKRHWRRIQPDWKKRVISRPNVGHCHPMLDTFGWKLQQQFRFDWVRFQYCGFNGQITGQDGTVHEDTHKDGRSENNLTFLFYDQEHWEDDWGGDLIFFNSEFHNPELGIGIPENEKDYEIGRIKYKPNRLIVVNGMISHRHPGPAIPYDKPNFPFRTSMVMRGDEIKLWKRGLYKHIEYDNGKWETLPTLKEEYKLWTEEQ